MAVIVDIDNEKYLADVGFGELFLEPKKLTVGVLQVDYTKYFKFLSSPNDEFILTSSADCSNFKKELFLIRFGGLLNSCPDVNGTKHLKIRISIRKRYVRLLPRMVGYL